MKSIKLILFTAKFLETISPKLAVSFAAKLFGTPLKHSIPKRELHMDENSVQKKVLIPAINKEIVTYKYGNSSKKVLLVHGWSGRGTQLVKIADALIENGYETLSFDAPAHGKSSGKTTLMPEFIESIHELDKQFGPFEAIVSHSLGSMASLNALAEGLKIEKTVVIGCANKVLAIFDDFINKIKLKPSTAKKFNTYFEKIAKRSMESLSADFAAKNITSSVLIIHDVNDDEIPVQCSYETHKAIKNSELFITEKLGHRKILGDKIVIEKILTYLKK